MIGIAIANSFGLNKLSGINPDAQAFIAAAGITNTTEIDAVNTLVNGLQTDGIWTNMKAVYPFVTDNRNLLSYTEDFGNAYWSVNNSTTSINSTTAPNGTATADSFIEDSTTSFKYIINPVTINGVAGETYTVSIYAKANTLATIQLTYSSSEFNNNYANFNLSNGSVGTYLGVVPTITSVGNGWYRCSMTNTMTTSGSVRFFVVLTNSSSATRAQSYLGTGKSVFIWGAQLELGSTATTYQPIATTQQAYIASQFKYNLKDPRDLDAAFRLVFNGGWTHSSTGATPNGTNAYADTKFNLSVNYSLTSLAFGGYTRTSSAFDGGYNGTTEPNFLHSFSGYALAESFIGTSYRSVASGILGMMQNNVEGGNHKIYKNNTLATSIGATITSLPNKNMFIGSAGLGFYNNHQLSFYYYSNGLTDTDAANLYTRVQAFQTSLSRQV